uniref:Uncharacterized protein n=1 Tax=Sphaerodactylus townsendi TaxID=933632 RepID=A0ACB8EFV7_9SAUR
MQFELRPLQSQTTQPAPGVTAQNPVAQGPVQDGATGSGTAARQLIDNCPEKQAHQSTIPPKPASHKGAKKGLKHWPTSRAGLTLKVEDSADEESTSETYGAEASNESSGNHNNLA